MVTVIKDKEAIYDVTQYDAVLVGISTHNTLMGNFQSKMGVRFPEIVDAIDSTPYGDTRKLGKRIILEGTEPSVCLMFICTYPSRKSEFVDYDALEKCLRAANAEFKGKKVATTLLGSSKFDGRGDAERCMAIIKDCCKDVDLYVYDYEQISVKDEIDRQKKYFRSLKERCKGDRNALEKINETMMEMRRKTYLPTDMYIASRKRKEVDDILNS